MNDELVEVAAKLLLWLVMMAAALPLNFLFIFAWGHSLVELWPHLFPPLSYWQGYLLLMVLHFMFPIKLITTWKRD